MVIAGVTLLGVGVASYVGLGVSAGIANHADTSARYLNEPGEEEEREDMLRRRDRARGAAIGTGVAACALVATGLALVIVGRRRAIADLQQRQRASRSVSWGIGQGIYLQGRF